MAESAVTVIGTLTSEPELRYDQGGRAQLSLRIAINDRFKQGNEWKDDTTFTTCWASGSLAENLSASVAKGSRVLCVGTMKQREWTDDNNQKVTVVGIRLDEAGPCLKWATALVERNPRKGGD